jgi:hypothetical protein
VTWKAPITMLVLLVLLLGAALYGWQTIISPGTEDETTTQPHKARCDDVQQFRRGERIRSDDIVVNVYNAGSIANLASDTLSDLETRGFQSGVADNAPSTVDASNVTIVTTTKQAPEVQLVALQFKGQIEYTSGPALEPGIDVVVGDVFKGIDKGAKKMLRVKRDVSTCSSVGSASS